MIEMRRSIVLACFVLLVLPGITFNNIQSAKASTSGGNEILIGKLKIIDGSPSIEIEGSYYQKDKNCFLIPTQISEQKEKFKFYIDWEIHENSHYKEKWVFKIVLGGSYQEPCKSSDEVTIYDRWGKDDSFSTVEHPEKRLYIEDRPSDAENSWPETRIVLKAMYYKNDDPVFWTGEPTLRKKAEKEITLHFCFYPPKPNKLSTKYSPLDVNKEATFYVGGNFAPSLYVGDYTIVIDFGDGSTDSKVANYDYKHSYWLEFHHTYTSAGRYKVKARAIEHKLGLKSEWKEMTVKVKKKKNYNTDVAEENNHLNKEQGKIKVRSGISNYLLNRIFTTYKMYYQFSHKKIFDSIPHLHSIFSRSININLYNPKPNHQNNQVSYYK